MFFFPFRRWGMLLITIIVKSNLMGVTPVFGNQNMLRGNNIENRTLLKSIVLHDTWLSALPSTWSLGRFICAIEAVFYTTTLPERELSYHPSIYSSKTSLDYQSLYSSISLPAAPPLVPISSLDLKRNQADSLLSAPPSFSATSSSFPNSSTSQAPPFLVPSNAPLSSPSYLPTENPSSSAPSIPPSSLSPSSSPSSLPTFPTSGPSSFSPTITSPLIPDIPATSPTISPTVSESSYYPSISPSSSSTPNLFGSAPNGEPGIDFWYLVSAECTLFGVAELTDEIVLSAQSAFQFALTDNMNSRDKWLVQVLAQKYNKGHASHHRVMYQRNSVQHSVAASDVDSSETSSSIERVHSKGFMSDNDKTIDDGSSTLEILIWSPTIIIAQNVLLALSMIEDNPLYIVLPMHEENVDNLRGVSITILERSITGHGTVFVFSFWVFVAFYVKRHFERHPDTTAYLRPILEARLGHIFPAFRRGWAIVVPLGKSFMGFFTMWCQDFVSRNHHGFHRASQEEEVSTHAEECQSIHMMSIEDKYVTSEFEDDKELTNLKENFDPDNNREISPTNVNVILNNEQATT